MMRAAAVYIALALFAALPARAQDPTPANIAGSILMFFAVVNECSIPGAPGLRDRLARAGEQLQSRFSLPDADLERAAREFATEAKRVNCPEAKRLADENGRRLAEMAEGQLAR